jgi:predicted site-specific integrase-resolvase
MTNDVSLSATIKLPDLANLWAISERTLRRWCGAGYIKEFNSRVEFDELGRIEIIVEVPLSEVERIAGSTNKLYTVQQFARMTGYSRATLYLYTETGKVNVVRFGNNVVRYDVQRMIEIGELMPVENESSSSKFKMKVKGTEVDHRRSEYKKMGR